MKSTTVATVCLVLFMSLNVMAEEGPVITTILGAGLKKEYWNPTGSQDFEKVARELAEAGFTMSWAASPVPWEKHSLLENQNYFAYYNKIRAVMRERGIGIAMGFHWRSILPGPPESFPSMYGEKLDHKTGEFVKTKEWDYGSSAALKKFTENARIFFKKTAPFGMFYADEITLASVGKEAHLREISTYWTSPTYSTEALASFRDFLADKECPGAEQALFPVTTVAVEAGPKANMGLPAVPINATNSKRLAADNNWPDSQLWRHWYEWRCHLYSQWLHKVTALAYEANKDNPNWMGCYYEAPVHWMVPALGQDIEQIVNLPHIDYIVAGYTTGQRYDFVKDIAEANGKGWGLQVEVSRYGRAEGMPVEYIEKTFKDAVNDGASIIACYAGMSFRSDLQWENVSEGYRKNGRYFMPEQVETWKRCIDWLENGRGLKRTP